MRRMVLSALVAMCVPAAASAAEPGLSDLMRARNFGMGGAFRALGGGTEAVEGNPASMAVFRRYLVELSGAWDARYPFGFGSIGVMDSASSPVAAGVAYHLVSLGEGAQNRIAHLNTGAFTLPVGQTLYVGASARYVLMSGVRQANAM